MPKLFTMKERKRTGRIADRQRAKSKKGKSTKQIKLAHTKASRTTRRLFGI